DDLLQKLANIGGWKRVSLPGERELPHAGRHFAEDLLIDVGSAARRRLRIGPDDGSGDAPGFRQVGDGHAAGKRLAKSQQRKCDEIVVRRGLRDGSAELEL